MLFNHDWWFGTAYRERIDEAKRRCTRSHFPGLSATDAEHDEAFQRFFSEVETRTIVYLRDGFSYELKSLVETRTTGSLTFECMPADDAYKVGAFVVAIPFDEIVRVEIFAVHPKEKPEDMLAIKGFSSAQAPQPGKRPDDRTGRSESPD